MEVQDCSPAPLTPLERIALMERELQKVTDYKKWLEEEIKYLKEHGVTRPFKY